MVGGDLEDVDDLNSGLLVGEKGENAGGSLFLIGANSQQLMTQSQMRILSCSLVPRSPANVTRSC